MDDAAAPLLLFVVGPPAVGKMSVGQAVTERAGLRLFHNHISIELALRYFDYGTPAFRRLDGEIAVAAAARFQLRRLNRNLPCWWGSARGCGSLRRGACSTPQIHVCSFRKSMRVAWSGDTR
jgi:hypothetical protein